METEASSLKREQIRSARNGLENKALRRDHASEIC